MEVYFLHLYDGWASTEWSRCPGSMAQRARDSVAPLHRSSAGWMPARIGRLSAGIKCRHPVTICKVLLIRQVWTLRHQTGAQYSAVECNRSRMTVCRVVGLAPQPEPVNRLRSATRDVSFLQVTQVLAIREQPVQRYSEVFGLGAEGQDFTVVVDFHLTFSFLVVEAEGCWHCFCSAELNFQV